jgi:intracellular sulfur oxidation DsrE/DsrF family protein
MKIFLTLFFAVCLFFSFSIQAQHYPFGSDFKCSSEPGDSLIFLDATTKLAKSLSELQRYDKLYGYDVSSHVDKSDDGDSTHFSIMLLAKDQAEFEILTKEWEKANTEVLRLLKEKCPTRTDEQFWDQSVSLPVVKNMAAMVIDVNEVDYKPNPNMEYKMIIDFTVFEKVDPDEEHSHEIKPGTVNWGLGEIGRLVNLHAGAGIPQKNIKFVAAVHGLSSQSFMTNEAYNKMHKMDNPNIAMLNELSAAGVEFMICGQSLGEVKKTDLLPLAKLTFTAQTTLSEFQMKGYAIKVLKND